MPAHADHVVMAAHDYAIAKHQGHRRAWQCDAAAVHLTEAAAALVVADGVGDHYDAAEAALLAAPTAATAAAVSRLATVGVHAARGALAALYPEDCPPGQDGDCVLVVALWQPHTLSVAWAGDARAWRLGAAGVLQLTSDHTKAAELQAAEASSAYLDVLRHHVTATAARGQIGFCEVDLGELPPQRLLLASDGLHGYVVARAIERILETEPAPQDAAAALVDAALAAGGLDNVAVIVADPPRQPDTGPGI